MSATATDTPTQLSPEEAAAFRDRCRAFLSDHAQPGARRNLAAACEFQGKLAEALETYREASDLDPANQDLRLAADEAQHALLGPLAAVQQQPLGLAGHQQQAGRLVHLARLDRLTRGIARSVGETRGYAEQGCREHDRKSGSWSGGMDGHRLTSRCRGFTSASFFANSSICVVLVPQHPPTILTPCPQTKRCI